VANEPIQPQFPDAPSLPDAGAVQPPPTPPTAPPQPPAPPAPPALSDEDLEPEPRRPHKAQHKSRADRALPWVLAAVVVLLLAASGGLVSAWVVATLRAVPAPALADATPSPSPAASSGSSAAPTPVPSEQPRHTPTPSPVVTQEPAPFIHVVQPGEYLQYIADLYGVTVEDIVALNDITNPNRIRVGRELLIPGYGHQPSPSPGHG
jgi:LysM repeat protein